MSRYITCEFESVDAADHAAARIRNHCRGVENVQMHDNARRDPLGSVVFPMAPASSVSGINYPSTPGSAFGYSGDPYASILPVLDGDATMSYWPPYERKESTIVTIACADSAIPDVRAKLINAGATKIRTS